jgi:two-component system, OmpR family, response regulator
MRLLIVEDEPDLANVLCQSFEEAHFAVDLSQTGEDALLSILESPYDAIILDVMLPGLDGWTVLSRMRADRKRTPVLILTARDAVEDRVRGLNLGADDYLVKPFALAELTARINAMIRRAAGEPSAEIVVGDFRIDTLAKRVFRRGVEMELTGREYAIFELLIRSRGRPLQRSAIAAHIYNHATDVYSNTIDVHIAALRRKLGSFVIRTRRGEGYTIDV